MINIEDITGSVSLHNNISMPYLGLGVYKTNDGKEITNAIASAFENGYRLIDTASYYNNEVGVGQAVKDTQIPREEIFITTKVWNDDHGFDATLKAFETSLDKLQMDYVDMYMIHWPMPELYVATWKAMETIYKSGKAKAIGVCNCMPHHIETLIAEGCTKPMVLQNEFHPRLVQNEILDFCEHQNIQFQAWSPLMRGRILDNDVLQHIAKQHKVSTAQVIIRWNLQKGVCTIPKSVHPERIANNAAVFHFELSKTEMQQIDALDKNERTGAHPDHFVEHFAKKHG